MARGTRRVVVVTAVAVILFVGTVGWAAANTTFFWDDYFILLTLNDRGLPGALVTGINGNWWPLATLIQWAEVKVFGLWYPGYLMVNGALIAATAVLLALICRPWIPRSRWLVAAIGIAYATSLGVLFNATVITPSWPMSVLLGVLAAWAWIRERPLWMWGGLLALCFLAQSGMFASNAAIAAALMLVARMHTTFGWRAPDRRSVITALVVVFLGLLGLLIGYVIATQDPINYYGGASQAAQDGVIVRLPRVSLLPTLSSVLSFTSAWSASPLLPGALVVPSFMPWLVILFETYRLPYLLGLVIIAATATWLIRRRRYRWVDGPILVVIILLLPAAQLAAILAVVRTGSGLAPRYWILWLIPVLAAWLVALTIPASGRIWPGVLLAGRVLLAATALVGIVALPHTLRQAMDTDKDRWDSSAVQRQAIEDCRSAGVGTSNGQVAPGLKDEDLCRAVDYIDGNALFR